jgi:PhnB protein
MARTSTYLNFAGNTEQAFQFYKSAFRTDLGSTIHRMGDVPPGPGMPASSDEEKNRIMHIELPITGGHVLMGTDTLESMGQTLVFGNTPASTWNRTPASRRNVDQFGVQWMINCLESKG